MAYPKQAKGEDPNAESRTVAPEAPKTERVVPAQVKKVRGGAPRLKQSVMPQRGTWQGKSAQMGSAGTLPTPPMMTLPQTQEQISNFVGETKARFDATLQRNPEVVARNPRFWRAYQEFPEGVATMLARRAYTDQILGAGNVADWMRFLEGLGA